MYESWASRGTIRVVARASRKRIGVIDSDAKVFGGADFESGRTRLPWAIVGELRKRYEVVQITPYEPIQERVDVLLVVLPSTLLQREMDNVFEAIRRGVPGLLIVDPVPAMDMRLEPAAPMAARMNPYAQPTQAFARKNTGDVVKAMASIDVNWPPVRIAWDSYRPRPELAQLLREVVFVCQGNGNPAPFNRTHPTTSGLQDLMLMYPGYLEPANVSGFTFESLAQTGPLAGTESYFQLVQPSPAGPVLNVNLPHQPEGKVLTLAAHIQSAAVSVIVIADLDFVSDQFFEMRANTPGESGVDNIAFFLNCIDVLAKDDAFIQLRRRRGPLPHARTRRGTDPRVHRPPEPRGTAGRRRGQGGAGQRAGRIQEEDRGDRAAAGSRRASTSDHGAQRRGDGEPKARCAAHQHRAGEGRENPGEP